MDQPTLQQIKDAFLKKGYQYFSGSKPYNLNIWGIRKQFGQIDLFDDCLGISYIDEDGIEQMMVHKATCDPGKYYMLTKLGNPNGTFILAPGQYIGCWKTGKHGKTKYNALVQKNNYKGFNGWRDNILDGQLQRKLDVSGNYFKDVQGLNMHRSSSSYSTIVGEFSAGCQVRQYNVSHLKVWDLIQKALIHFPDSFSYTLFDEDDVFGVPAPLTTRGGTSISPKKWPEDYIIIE
jgi:hypothetical protein